MTPPAKTFSAGASGAPVAPIRWGDGSPPGRVAGVRGCRASETPEGAADYETSPGIVDHLSLTLCDRPRVRR
eukprot:15475851-Alexandrium_andersonii.AAC.1